MAPPAMFGSHVVNKSTKKVAPIVKARRNRSAVSTASASSTAPANSSTERRPSPDSVQQTPPPPTDATDGLHTRSNGKEKASTDHGARRFAQRSAPGFVLVEASKRAAKPSSTTTAARPAVSEKSSTESIDHVVESESLAPQTQAQPLPARTETSVTDLASNHERTPAPSDSQNKDLESQKPTERESTKEQNQRDVQSTPATSEATVNKRRSKRKVTDPDANENESEANVGPPSKKPRKVRKDKGTTRKPKPTTPDETSVTGEGSARGRVSSRGRRRARSTRSRSATETSMVEEDNDDDDDDDDDAEEEEDDDDEDGHSLINHEEVLKTTRKRRKRKPRSPTPEDAEDHRIDTAAVTMADLTADRRRGQISEREKAMREINWVEVNKRRKERLNRPPTPEPKDKPDTDANPPGPNPQNDPNEEEETDENGDRVITLGPALATGPRLQITADGRLEVMESSTVIDRNANALSTTGITETIEEDDLTMQINHRSYIFDNKRDPADRRLTPNDRWRVADDEKFYECLGMFGTDFGMIAKMFPERTRRNIKHKFTREERANPELVKAALVGKVKTALDIQKYLTASQGKEEDLVDPRKLDAELEAMTAEHQPEIDAARKEHEETERQRKIAGGAASRQTPKEGEEPAKKKTKKKGKNANRGGEAEEEIIGSIEDFDDVPFPRGRFGGY